MGSEIGLPYGSSRKAKTAKTVSMKKGQKVHKGNPIDREIYVGKYAMPRMWRKS